MLFRNVGTYLLIKSTRRYYLQDKHRYIYRFETSNVIIYKLHRLLCTVIVYQVTDQLSHRIIIYNQCLQIPHIRRTECPGASLIETVVNTGYNLI